MRLHDFNNEVMSMVAAIPDVGRFTEETWENHLVISDWFRERDFESHADGWLWMAKKKRWPVNDEIFAYYRRGTANRENNWVWKSHRQSIPIPEGDMSYYWFLPFEAKRFDYRTKAGTVGEAFLMAVQGYAHAIELLDPNGATPQEGWKS